MWKEKFAKIQEEIARTLQGLEVKKLEKVKELLLSHKRVFLYGEGRTGLIAKTFGIRLIQLGKDVFFVGESLTPSFTSQDLLIGMSGRGKSKKLLLLFEKAKEELKGTTLLITGNPNTAIKNFCDELLIIPNSVKSLKKDVSIQPLNSLFEQSLFFLLDTIILVLVQDCGLTEVDLLKRHANL